ncbi:hypothetical protein DPEC_G00025830 [Dallia pectoralis]|uniref:Uncharacterized protein n=1 Tax=Dallia pectoralis TaxID=75939 RepID=A0ACC2HI95_DALPE|nr:hypothetical protein DPEC_G00025830 [Dallia pectoralis]
MDGWRSFSEGAAAWGLFWLACISQRSSFTPCLQKLNSVMFLSHLPWSRPPVAPASPPVSRLTPRGRWGVEWGTSF